MVYMRYWRPDVWFKLFGFGWKENFAEKPKLWSRLDIADKLAITCFCASLFGALAGVAIALAVVN